MTDQLIRLSKETNAQLSISSLIDFCRILCSSSSDAFSAQLVARKTNNLLEILDLKSATAKHHKCFCLMRQALCCTDTSLSKNTSNVVYFQNTLKYD